MTTALPDVDDVYPLTATQQGMLYHTLSDPSSGVYLSHIITPITGEVDITRFQAAWAGVVRSHEALRTSFIWDGLDQPLQVVRSAVEHEWIHFDLTGMSAEEQDERIEQYLVEDRRRGVDLGGTSLTRMALVRRAPSAWTWIWTSPHIILDGWSTNLLVDELLERYEYGDVQGADGSSPRFRDFVAQYLDRDEHREEVFWRERLAGFTDPHRLEVPGLAPEPGSRGFVAHTITLSPGESADVAALARGLNVTLNTVFLGAWALVLSRWARTTDVVFGATMAGRPPSLPGIERTAGLFINTLPQRVRVSSSATLGQWLPEVQRDQIAIREFEQSSLASVQRWSDVDAGTPLFESILVFENYPPRDGRSHDGALSLEAPRVIEHSNYPLAVLVHPGDTIDISFVYDSSILSSAAIDVVASQVRSALGGFVADPNGRLATYRLTDASHDDRLVRFGTGPELGDGGDDTIDDVIERVADRTPDEVALVDPGGSITYAELLERSHLLASRLAAEGAGPDVLVGLHIPRSIDMVVGMLGILQSGGAYVPLDPSYPAAHVDELIADSGIELVLTTSGLADRLPDAVSRVLVDGDSEHRRVEPTRATPENLAYVIHTSGSTGRPKGVAVTHRNLVRSTRARSVHYRDPVGTFLLLSSFSFDSSVAGIFWTLASGGTLVLPEPTAERDVAELLALAERHGVTHTLCLPSLYEILLEEASSGELDALEVAIVAGEACPARVLDAHRRSLPRAELHNEYGPTEATVWCTAHRASDADEVLPIGRPIAGTRVHLLDDHGNPVPAGFAGEICVAGAGVVSGYLGRPDLTAERFVTTRVFGEDERIYRTGDLAAWRDDGVLVYLGRADAQLKVRGHRIEPAAVETRLRAHRSIDDAVVVGRGAPGRPSTQLVAYVATDPGVFDETEVRRDLADGLPAFMVPDVIVPLEEIPRLPNGKVDPGSLPDPREHATPNRAIEPRTERERLLASIWSDLLGIETVGIRDDFFELGGDSIVSIRMISRARQAGLRIAPGAITRHPTIEALATAADDGPSAVAEALSGAVPLGPIQHWFFEMEHPAPAQWNMSRLLAVSGRADADALEKALRACVEHHDMLRARFEARDGSWNQTVAADMDLRLEISEASDQIEALCARVDASLDLRGPLLRALLIRRPTDDDLLFIAVHHLVIDAVSWTILIDDLDRAYVQATEGVDIDLPARTTSYREWVERIDSDPWVTGREHWLTHRVDERVDRPLTWGTEGSRQTVTVELDPATTDHLLRSANDAYRTKPDELMIAALVDVLDTDRSGGVCIAVEGHGRPDDMPGIDLSRTVGWFTAQYPVRIAPTGRTHAEVITATKEALRSVPTGGIGYGVLRYLRREPHLVDEPEPTVLFNYLGRSTGHDAGAVRRIPPLSDSRHHPENRRAHRIEVEASLRENALVVEWHTSDAHDRRTAIEDLAQRHLELLRSIVTHCLADDVGGLSPSDFPEAGLDQAGLDRFLDGLT